MQELGRARGAQESEFTEPPARDPEPVDPIGPASQKWIEVVAGRRERQQRSRG